MFVEGRKDLGAFHGGGPPTIVPQPGRHARLRRETGGLLAQQLGHAHAGLRGTTDQPR